MADEIGALSILPAYTAGLISVLTPCVYPLIPITLSVVGLTGADSLGSRIRNALAYILGIVATYTILGIVAAKTGALFGSALASRPVLIGFGLMYWLLGLLTLDLFQIPLFHKLQQKAGTLSAKGVFGALVMGLVSGFVAAPCIGPALVAILSYAASSQNLLYGGTLLATYALGFGTPFLFLAIFAGAASRLPRSGNWLLWIKFVMAVLLFGAGLAFAAPALNLPVLSIALISAIFGLGLLLAFTVKLRPIAAILVGVASALVYTQHPNAIFNSSTQNVESALKWNNSIDTAIQAAKQNNQIIMVDFFAEWCAACKEFEHITFPSPGVSKALSKMNLVRIDMTFEGAEIDVLTERFKILGLPWITFLAPDGSEFAGHEITGFLKPEDFLAHLQKVPGFNP
jgi:thiol:disulfide interchange protein DsbD